jgi:hypothetical protein
MQSFEEVQSYVAPPKGESGTENVGACTLSRDLSFFKSNYTYFCVYNMENKAICVSIDREVGALFPFFEKKNTETIPLCFLHLRGIFI